MWTAVAFLLLVISTRPVDAQHFVAKDFGQLVAEAEQIFVGRVRATESRRLSTDFIVTDVTFESPTTLKGREESEIVLEVSGGTVDGETVKIGGLPRFTVGRTYLVFSKENGRAIFPIVGGHQGLFEVRRDLDTGEEIVLDAYGKPVAGGTFVDAARDDGRPPGSPAPPRLTLKAVMRAIQARLQQ